MFKIDLGVSVFYKPVVLVELLILYACVQFYMHRASDYRLISDCNLKQELPVVAMVVNGSGQNE
jgi:hypothetical protein